MKKNPVILWLTALALGWLADFLFWKQPPGVNFALFVIFVLLGAFFLLLRDGLRPRPATLALILPIGFFSASTFFRLEPLTVFLSVVFTLLSMSLLAVSYLGGGWIFYAFGDYIGKAFALAGSALARPLIFLGEVRREQSETPVARSRLFPVLRGALFALPVVVFFATLLASADLVFGQQLERAFGWLRLENMPELIFRLAYIFAIAYALAGVILHAATQSQDDRKPQDGQKSALLLLGFTESAIVLGSVLALFAAFVLVQFQYFFGGETNIAVDGYTYAEYARRGFGELVVVAFFSLLMLVALNAITRRETDSQRAVYSALGAGLVALLLVILFSAFKRLGLYEDAYGFSRLRTYTHVFLVWLGILLMVVMALETSRRERWLPFAMLVAAAGFAASLSILNVDAFIVRHNIARESLASSADRDGLDAPYFTELSDDAVSALAAAYTDPQIPITLREKAGAALTCIRFRRGQQEFGWRSFHLSRWQAEQTLSALKLSAYELDESGYFVVTPGGEAVSCYVNYMD